MERIIEMVNLKDIKARRFYKCDNAINNLKRRHIEQYGSLDNAVVKPYYIEPDYKSLTYFLAWEIVLTCVICA